MSGGHFFFSIHHFTGVFGGPSSVKKLVKDKTNLSLFLPEHLCPSPWLPELGHALFPAHSSTWGPSHICSAAPALLSSSLCLGVLLFPFFSYKPCRAVRREFYADPDCLGCFVAGRGFRPCCSQYCQLYL